MQTNREVCVSTRGVGFFLLREREEGAFFVSQRSISGTFLGRREEEKVGGRGVGVVFVQDLLFRHSAVNAGAPTSHLDPHKIEEFIIP